MMSPNDEYMEREFSQYELRILYNMCRQGTWCDKHLNINKITNGIPKHDLDKAKYAAKELKNIGLIAAQKKQGREDYCMPKPNREIIIDILKKYEEDWGFIQFLDLIK